MNTPAVGDINSSAKGTGARYNGGKPPVELLLWRPVAAAFRSSAPADICDAMECLGWYQETHETAYLRDLIHSLYAGDFRQAMIEAAQVFGFGAKKYKAWNWAKGMAWSVPLACIGRHLMAVASGEENDPESELPHRGHVVCNVVMLLSYKNIYREGNDLPTLFLGEPDVQLIQCEVRPYPNPEPEVELIPDEPVEAIPTLFTDAHGFEYRASSDIPCHLHPQHIHCNFVVPGHGHPCREPGVLDARLTAHHFDRRMI